VADNGRFFTTQKGEPFFWLANRAPQLIQDHSREEVEAYFRKRAAERFTVIQTVALAEHGGLDRPPAYGSEAVAIELGKSAPRILNTPLPDASG
jgi:hypothetical protein